ncbi:MAG: hypothetical protein WD278_14990 [Pirellulales bacterium]
MSISPDQIVLSEEQKQRLARLAEQTGRPWDEVFVDALSTFEQLSLAKPQNGESRGQAAESVYQAMVRLGLLGSVKDAPPDLSTNPKYMEGFGERDR